jgi:ParB/RepB/Spo0J family partition protein
MENLQNIPVKSISIAQGGTRTTSDTKAQHELSNSIAEYGLLQPITVAPDPKKKGKYLVVMGRRRFAACKELGWKDIDAFVSDLNANSLLQVEIQENITRHNLTLLEEAAIVVRLSNENNPIPVIASMLCKPTSWVYLRLKVGRLPEVILDAYKEGKLTRSKLLLLLQHTNESLAEAVEIIKAGKHLSVYASTSDLSKASFSLLDSYDHIACVECPLNCATHSLFDEPKNTCMNRTCFDAKTKAEQLRKFKDHLASGGLVMLSENEARSYAIEHENVLRPTWPQRNDLTHEIEEGYEYVQGERIVTETEEECKANLLSIHPDAVTVLGVGCEYLITPENIAIIRNGGDAEPVAADSVAVVKEKESENVKAIRKMIEGKHARFNSYKDKHKLRKSEYLKEKFAAAVQEFELDHLAFNISHVLLTFLRASLATFAPWQTNRGGTAAERAVNGFIPFLSKGFDGLAYDETVYVELMETIAPGELQAWVDADLLAIATKENKMVDAIAILERDILAMKMAEQEIANRPIPEPIDAYASTAPDDTDWDFKGDSEDDESDDFLDDDDSDSSIED